MHTMHAVVVSYFNPRCMCKGYGSRFVCVFVCTMLAATYLIYTSKLWHFLDLQCVAFAENTLLKSYKLWYHLLTTAAFHAP